MGSTRVILLVHPEDENRIRLQVMLKGEGYAVNEAEDVTGALKQIRESVPDLVVTCVRLPRTPGTELIRTIRSDASYPRVNVIALGANDTEDDAMSAGADAFLTWPGRPHRLVEVVKRMMGRG